MIINTCVRRCALRHFGGKWKLAKWLIPHMRSHFIYVEPYLGGGSILLRKPKATIEVASEIHERTYNFWEIVKRYPDLLIEDIMRIRINRDLMKKEVPSDEVKNAAQYFVQCQLEFTGGGIRWTSGATDQRIIDVKKWMTEEAVFDHIKRVNLRVENVTFHADGDKIVNRYINNANALIYFDPPYLNRKSKDARHKEGASRRQYLHDWNEVQHIKMLNTILNSKCMWMLSGYHNPLYEEYLSDQHYVQKDDEVLWLSQQLWDSRPREATQAVEV